MDSLKGKNALITGASRGIGLEISRMLAAGGANLAMNARHAANLEKACEELTGYGVRLCSCPGDLADAEVPSRLVEQAVRELGSLDIVISNAGIAVPNAFMDTTCSDWDLHMAINARAPFLLSREAVPHLRKSGGGTVVFISSVVGTKGYVNQMAYSASKHALMGMAKVLAQEVYRDNIRVHAVSPGGVATEMASQMRPDLDLTELITPGEVAEVVHFLLTHRGNAVIDEVSLHRSTAAPWK